ncbi:hypothetical protein CERZMDRAFT_93650 [Cercospora zeae-maydis SCOH1-5]|uniref:Uncharacterized protein n=1 Tax=Cercospora zeae-maydis SCOH1-5 TaxID=717836 RepID=A0A6A6FST4_9PEZI|nr:hypothetical protein CERZMDRAFT_93650 [Cercospora zeae-maydis SCOH1-5]
MRCPPTAVTIHDEAVRRAMIDERGYFEDDQPIDPRVKIAARRGHIAKHYFPRAADYAMSGTFAKGHDETAAMWQAFERFGEIRLRKYHDVQL